MIDTGRKGAGAVVGGRDRDASATGSEGVQSPAWTLRFPPEPMEGIVVVRPPRAILPAIRATLVSILGELKSRPLKGMLWIIEPGRIRVYDAHEDPTAP
jgi:hypothetical protein